LLLLVLVLVLVLVGWEKVLPSHVSHLISRYGYSPIIRDGAF